MITITNFQQDVYFQTFQVKLDNNEILFLEIEYNPVVTCFFMNLQYKETIINCIKITCFYSLLSMYKNILPFDIACFHEAGLDPDDVNDFVNGYATLNILTQNEVVELENEIL